MQICVYTIAKNESKFVKRWVDSAKDADYLLVADTGSTDNTIELLTNLNVKVINAAIEPFRFDYARNISLSIIPYNIDVCICLDMDEVLTAGWREKLEKAWLSAPGVNHLRYKYYWNFDAAGKPIVTYMADKIHGRYSHKWQLPVHEVLQPLENEVWAQCDDLLIEHHADNSKSRSNYLALLEMSVLEAPENDRNCHYLGREYFFYGKFESAIAELKRHLSLASAVWLPERAASMRYIAKSYLSLTDNIEAEYWFVKAVEEDTSSKEALIDLAKYYLAKSEYRTAIYYAQKVIYIDSSVPVYLTEQYAQNEGPYDIQSVANFYLNLYDLAYANAVKALQLNPNDTRLQKNLQFAADKVSG